MIRTLCAINIYFLSSYLCLAEEQNNKKYLALSDVLSSATQHHPSIGEALALRDAAENKLLSSQGAFDPVVKLKSRYYGSGYYEGTNSTSSLLSIPLETASTDLFIGGRTGHGDFPIYEDEYDTLDIGELGAGLRLALLRDRAIDNRRTAIALNTLEVQQQKSKADLTKLLVLEEAAIAYWDWTITRATQSVFYDLLKVSEKRQDQFEEQVRLGQLAAIEALDNSRAILNRRQKLLEQKQKTVKSWQKLSLFYRNPDGAPKTISAIRPRNLPAIKSPDPNIINKVEQQLSNRPDVLALQNEVDQLRKELALAENSFLPTLDLETSITKDYGEGEPSREGTEWKSMLIFEVPIQRREARGKIREIESKIRAKQEQIRLLKDEIRTLATAITNVVDRSHQRYLILQREVDLSEQLEIAELEKFKAGASNLMLVAIREIATANVRADLLETLFINRTAYLKLYSLANDPHGLISN